MKKKKIEIQYQDVCFDCGNRLYGPNKWDLGAITIHFGICPVCGQEKAIKPAIDWYNERKAVLRAVDID